MTNSHHDEEAFRPFAGGYVEKRYVVEQYQDALGDLVGDAVRAGAFEDCVQAVDTLYPFLVKRRRRAAGRDDGRAAGRAGAGVAARGVVAVTTAHHGTATVTIDVHHGHLEAVIEVEGQKLIVADAQSRDLTRCLVDLYPSLDPNRKPAHLRPEPEILDARMCQYCGQKFAQIFDVDGAWCGDEHQAYDRQSESTWWRKSVGS